MSLRRFKYAAAADWEPVRSWLTGRQQPESIMDDPVRTILNAVREHGDRALVEYTRKFDCKDFHVHQIRVPGEAIAQAVDEVPRPDLDIISEAAANIRSFHERQVRQSWIDTGADGAVQGQLVRPVDRAGLYVPGGKGGETPLLSSLLMNAIPAQVAGVAELAVVSPPRQDASLNPYLLATAALLGIEEIYMAGSAWAIAGLAYGTTTIPAVDMVTGPGNIFVTTAKRLLLGQVGIDMLAGPSEIVVLADGSARPEWVAADLLSQAEHDPLASAICIAVEEELLDEVEQALFRQLEELDRREIARQSLDSWGALVEVPDVSTGIDLVNLLAPEHFELCVQDPWHHVGRLRNAGAVFMGHHTCEPLGDYFAGPNHILPTMGTARFSSALSVETFCKRISLVASSPGYVAQHGSKVARLARLEGLEAHARSMEKRLKTEDH